MTEIRRCRYVGSIVVVAAAVWGLAVSWSPAASPAAVAATPADAGPGGVAGGAGESDWPQFLGPNQDNTSSETGLLRAWPREGPKVLWRVPIDIGLSSPAVADGRVYINMTLVEGNKNYGNGVKESLLCVNAQDGSKAWDYVYDATQPYSGGQQKCICATPTIAGPYVYSLGFKGDLFCLDRITGKKVWYVSLGKDVFPDVFPPDEHKETKNCVMSPIVADGKLFIFRFEDDSRGKAVDETRKLYLACLDAATGKLAWKNFNETVRPLVIGADGQTSLVLPFGKGGGDKCFVFSGNHMLKALRVSDGKEIWNFAYQPMGARGTWFTPLAPVGDDLLELPEGGMLSLVHVDRQNPPFAANVVWQKPHDEFKCTDLYHNFLPHDGYLYGLAGNYKSHGHMDTWWDDDWSLYCLDQKTGATVWKQDGFRQGVSLIEADGLLFVRDQKTLRLVEATPKGYVEKGKVATHAYNAKAKGLNQVFQLMDCVTPALSHGRLYIRTPEELLCYDVQDHAAAKP